MPRLIIRFPRLSGAAMLIVGAWSVTTVARIAQDGGIYVRAVPVMMTICLSLGSWLLIVGRPADPQGFSPRWWNLGYVGILALALVVAMVVYGALLT